MEVSSRQKEMLQSIVEEYILSARPVSSGFLEKKHRFNVSPATIRSEMKKLTETGYLFQPHTSAGRIPTDKGYRFFVELLDEENGWESDLSEIKELAGQAENDFSLLFSELTRFLALASSTFCLSGLLGPNLLFKEGWSEVVKKPEFEESGYVVSFAEFIKEFENELGRFETDDCAQAYIGEESSLKGSGEFSIILARCDLGKREGIISILGPKRMEYGRNISLVSAVQQLLESF